MINENLARQAKENISFGDYKTNSATEGFNNEMIRVRKLIEEAKRKVSENGKERLEKLFNSYKVKYANWINKKNKNGASHVSVMICGAGNYNMRRHEKYLEREGKLWTEYEEFKNIDERIFSIVKGDKIIKSNDPEALQKLKIKLENLENLQEQMKATNKILRKKKLTDEEKINELIKIGYSEQEADQQLEPDFAGRVGFTYQLQNNNGNMRNIKLRIQMLEKAKEKGTTKSIINNIKVVDNVEANRIQLFFPDKPDVNIRSQLKSSGFRWTPSIGAWQGYRNERSRIKAKEIVENF